MSQYFIIKGRLPGLNEYTDSCRSNNYSGGKLKAEAEAFIGWQLKAQKLTPQSGPSVLFIKWYEPSCKRDIDNVAFAKKFIFDTLVSMGILEGDGRKHIPLFFDSFPVPDKDNPRIEVTILGIDESELLLDCVKEAVLSAKEVAQQTVTSKKGKGGTKSVKRSGGRINQLSKTYNAAKNRSTIYSRIQKSG